MNRIRLVNKDEIQSRKHRTQNMSKNRYHVNIHSQMTKCILVTMQLFHQTVQLQWKKVFVVKWLCTCRVRDGQTGSKT